MKNKLPVEAYIFIAGFISGMVVAIGLHTGISPDRISVMALLLDRVCETVPMENNLTLLNCGVIKIYVIVISVIVTILAIVAQVARANNRIIGLIVYGVGWIAGLVFFLGYA